MTSQDREEWVLAFSLVVILLALVGLAYLEVFGPLGPPLPPAMLGLGEGGG